MARPFLPAKNFDVSKRFYEALGFTKAENFMMQLMIDDLDAWWTHVSQRRPGVSHDE